MTAYIRRTYIRPWWRPGSHGTKDAENQRKHGISFAEARTVVADEYALLLDDPDHSASEERFILLGLSASFRMLVVAHTYREPDDTIRIIAARKATRQERWQYDQRWHP